MRLGSLVGQQPPQAQLDGFKSRALRPEASTLRQPSRAQPATCIRVDAVHLTEAGSIANLSIQPLEMPAPRLASNVARIDVQAAGLNFRDVLNVLGLDPTGTVRPIGGEAAGMVARVGATCAHVLVSDCVYGLLPGGLRTHVWCDARYIRCVHARNCTPLREPTSTF